jgi:hypothetical protein
LGLRTYGLSFQSVWAVGFLAVTAAAPLPGSIRIGIVLATVLYFIRALLFPVQLLVEWFRMVPDAPARPRAMRMMQCFQTYFRLHHNLQTLSRKPHLIVANYPNDRWESFAPFMLSCRFVFVIRASVDKYLKMSRRVPCILVPDTQRSYADILEQAQRYLAQGYHIFSYLNVPSNIHPRHVEPLRTGMLRIAQDLQIPVTAMAIDQIEPNALGGFSEQSFIVHLSRPFYVTDILADRDIVQTYFRRQLRRFATYKKNDFSKNTNDPIRQNVCTGEYAGSYSAKTRTN